MIERNFFLGIKNFGNIPFNKYDHHFTFIVNGKKYTTNRIIADILSPEIRKLHFIDESINEFSINTNKNKDKTDKATLNKEDYFTDFLSLSTFTNLKINQEQHQQFLKYFYLLGNIDECVQLTTENSVDYLLSVIDMESVLQNNYDSCSDVLQKLIEFIASHFEFIDKKELKKLDVCTIEEILRNESLKLKDEDSLLEFIMSLNETDETYSNLFEYIQIFNVSKEKFLSFINSNNYSSINSDIWDSIRSRILTSQSTNFTQKDVKRYFIGIKEFTFQRGEEFNGIMNYLSTQTKGNIHDNGTIKIDSNSIHNNSRHPKNLVDFGDTNVYQSKDDGDAFISFDFKDKFVQLSSYSIKSCNSNENGAHLKNWAIELSNEGENWIEIDRYQNKLKIKRQTTFLKILGQR
ncbi:hypothetical protein M9Y10_005797 [Tritrichomonas musculus]|uniref:BACK domain-containing protein n=1 Tax=Tritrichomonas musculus TaxID=1915356 RepID=A0ABR2JDI7_9EUKA